MELKQESLEHLVLLEYKEVTHTHTHTCTHTHDDGHVERALEAIEQAPSSQSRNFE